jgi:hypothetical protein|tara:strand:+ start:43 stop:1053 length:1011 start_codon:yes stop_codon:yes gene_type:complete
MSENVNYGGLDILTTKEPIIKIGDTMKICLYSISYNSNNKPFLEFLLHREDSKLLLPEIFHSSNTPSNDCIGVLKKMFNDDKSIEYMGYFANNILFFETNTNYNFATYKSKADLLWFVTVEEIINHHKSLHYDIDDSLIQLFLKNSELIYLVDKNNNNLETPLTGYYGKSINKVTAISVFGADKGNYKSSLGPFYYLGSYSRGIRYGCWSSDYKVRYINGIPITDNNGKYHNGGMVKFVFFSGSTNMSVKRRGEIKSGFDKIKSGADNNEYSGFDNYKETDKLWVDNFDTIILDKTTNIDEPQYVIRSNQMTIPIAYYSIDTSNVVRAKLHDITIE